jgi:hypothetical protein
MVRFQSPYKRGLMVWWNLKAKNWAGPGFGSVIARMAAALSAKM